MEQTVELTRPRHVPRTTRSPWSIAAIACGSTLLGFGSALLVVRGLIATPPPPPPPTPPPAAATPPPPDLEIDEAPAPEPSHPPRAAAPMLDARCLLGGDTPALCGWDSGLPAISEDGTTIVHVVGGALPGDAGTTVELVDAKTGHVAKVFPLVSADEASRIATDDPAAATARMALAGPVATRLAALAAILDAGHYRALAFLGADGSAAVDLEPDTTTYTTTFDGDALRLTAAGDTRVVFQRRLAVPRPAAPSADCQDVALDGMRTWFDARTRTLFAEEVFATGDEGCAPVEVPAVATVP